LAAWFLPDTNEWAAQDAGEPVKNIPRMPQKYTCDRKTPGGKAGTCKTPKKERKIKRTAQKCRNFV